MAQSSDAEFTGALEAAIEVFRRQTGAVPKGFRSPAWEMTPHMLAEIRRHGFWDSSLAGADHPYEIDGVVEVPVQWAIDDAVFFKFSGGGTDQWPPEAPGPILEGWLDEWEGLRRLNGLFMLTVHDWISGRAQRLRLLERLLERVTAAPGVWIATVGEVAAYHAGSANAGRFVAASRHPRPGRAAPLRAPGMNLASRKTEIRSRHGLVAAQHRYAAEAGAAVLARGGNAMDAAVVAALVLSVVEPWLSGIGGGGFLLHADGSTGAVSALDFNVRAPAALDPADYPLAERRHRQLVPMAVGGRGPQPDRRDARSACPAPSPAWPRRWSASAASAGPRRWRPPSTMPSAGWRSTGTPPSASRSKPHALARFAPTAALLLENGEAPKAAEGPHRPMPAKARMLRRLAQAGARDFYEGEIARTWRPTWPRPGRASPPPTSPPTSRAGPSRCAAAIAAGTSGPCRG